MLAGAAQRKQVAAKLDAGDTKSFRWLGISEAAIMAVAMGLGVALGRMAPPTGYDLQPVNTVESLVHFRMPAPDRKSVGSGKSVSVRLDLGDRRLIIKKT